MNFKKILVLATIVFSSAFAKAQDTIECQQMLSIFAENAKAKLYDEAYKQLNPLIEKCPTISAAIYQYGEKIYEYRLKNEVGDLNENVNGLILMMKTEIEDYSNIINPSKKIIQMDNVMYKYNIGTPDEQFMMYDKVFNEDPDNFTDPRGIMTYFKLAEDRYKDGKMTLQELFDLYDKLMAHIENLQDERSKIINDLLEKQNAGTITDKEEKQIGYQERNLKNYGIVQGSVNGTLGALADCDKLIPLYDAEFDEKKTDKIWLSNVLVRLQKKECTDDPLYIKSVKSLHALNPSAKTAYGLGNIATSRAERFKYWDQAIELGVDNDLKSRIHYKKGNEYKSQGQYGRAKREYILSNQAKPSFGAPFLKIAEMIAKSGSSCGTTPFEKRAINWVAARYAEKAGRVDPSLRSRASQAADSYNGTAPGKQDIFMSDKYNSGDTITFNCWVGESVRIP
jgi:tetratricopeptide (TPR) repeat protein